MTLDWLLQERAELEEIPLPLYDDGYDYAFQIHNFTVEQLDNKPEEWKIGFLEGLEERLLKSPPVDIDFEAEEF